jgi:hypothetical protein
MTLPDSLHVNGSGRPLHRQTYSCHNHVGLMDLDVMVTAGREEVWCLWPQLGTLDRIQVMAASPPEVIQASKPITPLPLCVAGHQQPVSGCCSPRSTRQGGAMSGWRCG